jgi:hypothetical protein
LSSSGGIGSVIYWSRLAAGQRLAPAFDQEPAERRAVAVGVEWLLAADQLADAL